MQKDKDKVVVCAILGVALTPAKKKNHKEPAKGQRLYTFFAVFSQKAMRSIRRELVPLRETQNSSS